jgi:competence protein ComEC
MALGFAAMAAGFVWGPAAALLDSLSAIVMGWVVQVAGLFARLPTASEIGVGPLLSVAVGASVGLLLRIRRTKRGRLGLAVVGALVGLLLAVGGSFLWARVGAPLWAEPWPAVVEVRVLDVGQGNATLIRTPGGRAILIDGGPADCRLAKQLSWLRVRKLDMVVVSHPHADHFAGLSECWGSIPIFGLIDGFPPAEPGLSVMGSGEEGDKNGDITGYLKLRSELIDSGAVYTPAAEISTFELEGVQVTVLNQELSARTLGSAAQRSGGGSSLSGEELNAASLVLVVRVGGVVILLPGDAEASVLARLPLEEVSVLVVSHHGSRGAVDERRLATLSPRLALISVGEGNSFGHPHPEVIGDLAKAACPVLRTDEVGSVALLVAEEGLQLRTDRPSSAVGARD